MCVHTQKHTLLLIVWIVLQQKSTRRTIGTHWWTALLALSLSISYTTSSRTHHCSLCSLGIVVWVTREQWVQCRALECFYHLPTFLYKYKCPLSFWFLWDDSTSSPNMAQLAHTTQYCGRDCESAHERYRPLFEAVDTNFCVSHRLYCLFVACFSSPKSLKNIMNFLMCWYSEFQRIFFGGIRLWVFVLISYQYDAMRWTAHF